MSLSLTPVTVGTRTLTANTATTSTVVYCSAARACSSTLACGEIGIGLNKNSPATLTFTAV